MLCTGLRVSENQGAAEGQRKPRLREESQFGSSLECGMQPRSRGGTIQLLILLI